METSINISPNSIYSKQTIGSLKEFLKIELNFRKNTENLEQAIIYLKDYLSPHVYSQLEKIINPCFSSLEKIESIIESDELIETVNESNFDNIINKIEENFKKFENIRIEAFSLCSQTYLQLTQFSGKVDDNSLKALIKKELEAKQKTIKKSHKDFFEKKYNGYNDGGDAFAFFSEGISLLFQHSLRYQLLFKALSSNVEKDLKKLNINTGNSEVNHNKIENDNIVTSFYKLTNTLSSMEQLAKKVNENMENSKIIFILTNILRIKEYYFNTKQAERLLNKTTKKNQAKTKWKPQLYDLLICIIAIYVEKDGHRKDERAIQKINETIASITRLSGGKNSRLVGSLNKVLENYATTQHVFKNHLPDEILNFNLSKDDAKQFIEQKKIVNSSNSCLAAKTLQYLDYYQYNRAGRLLTKQIKKKQTIKNCHAVISEQAEQQINTLRDFILSALQKNKPAAVILFKIDETISKIRSSFKVTENDRSFANALSYISAEYGGISSYYKKTHLIPDPVLNLDITLDAATQYMMNNYSAHLPKQENQPLNETNKDYDSLLENIIRIMDSYTEHRKNGAWMKLANTVKLEIIDIKNSKINISQEHILMYVKDIIKKIRRQSYFIFWGGVNSSLANTLEELHCHYKSEPDNQEHKRKSNTKSLLPVELLMPSKPTVISHPEFIK